MTDMTIAAAVAAGSPPARPRVIVVDDDAMIRELVCSVAETAECAAAPAGSIRELEGILGTASMADLIILDLDLGDTDGVSVLRRLHERLCKAPIIIVSGCHDRVVRSAVEFGRSLGLDMLPPLAKPFEYGQIQGVVRRYSQAHAPLTEAVVEQAIWNSEFHIYLQPIIDIATHRVIGAEALIRWLHPVRGMIYPDKFIPLIERCPVMLPLTLEVATQAVKAISTIPGELSVAINVPPICLGDAVFPDLLADLAAAAGVSPSRITVEVTETAAMEDPAFTSAQVTRLRIKGFQVALDDFGTGYASLVELHRMPVSAIKIDRSFVANLLTDKSAEAITRSIVGLGRSLDLQVVAEGVENLATLERLRTYACDLAQGYHIARPLPAADLADWIVSWAGITPAHTFG